MGDGTVSLELLDNKLDALRERSDEADKVTHRKLDAICDELSALNGYVRDNDRRITRVEERQKLIAGLQVGLTAVASTIAAFLGIQS